MCWMLRQPLYNQAYRSFPRKSQPLTKKQNIWTSDPLQTPEMTQPERPADGKGTERPCLGWPPDPVCGLSVLRRAADLGGHCIPLPSYKDWKKSVLFFGVSEQPL